ncbi:hypothetical protein H5410_031133 [Solanum commersonii]|uniref:Uncharacterized protein n=1 Tax=Solanum commersonii TaxID=4109 RepID=A0A9J5YGA6_SOLCO|nr:hypothetical protein H5410_031133 [Solanum commersonii]
MDKKPLFYRETRKPNVGQTKLEKRAYNAHNKAQEGESSVGRSARVRNKAYELKNNLDNDCKGKRRRTTKKKIRISLK